jgi:hypothetical protein
LHIGFLVVHYEKKGQKGVKLISLITSSNIGIAVLYVDEIIVMALLDFPGKVAILTLNECPPDFKVLIRL